MEKQPLAIFENKFFYIETVNHMSVSMCIVNH